MNVLYKITFCTLLLLSPMLCSAQEHNTIMVTGSLAKSECVNEILDAEIRHFIAQQDSCTEHSRYWNLIVNKDDRFTRIFLIQWRNKLPHEGSAYLQYGNDIIVICETRRTRRDKELAFFRTTEDDEKVLKMFRSDSKYMDNSFAECYLGIRFLGDRLCHKQSFSYPFQSSDWVYFMSFGSIYDD